jgi:hypothetical protein
MSETERRLLLEKAVKARKLAHAIPGDPAAQELLRLAAEYEALAARSGAAPPSQPAQQQQQPQPDPDTDKE